jgi:hypothetical protein
MPEYLAPGSKMLQISVPNELSELRPDLQRFFDAMIYKLRRNKHKGRWEDMALSDAFPRMEEEMKELSTALDEGSTTEILFEAADVANFALIIANIGLEARNV